jgi:hypothetical protein
MFEITKLPMVRPVNRPVLPCQRFPHVCIRLVDCTTHQGIPNVSVRVGNTNDNRVQEYLENPRVAPPQLDHEGRRYTIYAEGRTNARGWVCFPSVAQHRERGDILVLGGYALQVQVPHYHPVTDEGDYAEEAVPPSGPVATFDFDENKHTVVCATLRSERPILAADFDTAVSNLIANVDRIRVAVEQGPNLGNQSAALSLLLNLRRVGYQGPIDVLTNPAPNRNVAAWKLVFTAHATSGPGMAVAAQAVFDRLKHVMGASAQPLVALPHAKWSGDLDYVHPNDFYVVLTGENMRGLKSLPFPYKVVVQPDVADQEEDDFEGDTREPEVDVDGDAELPPAMYGFTFVVTVELTIDSLADVSVTAKLATLDPQYKTNPAYGGHVTWVELSAFASDVTANPRIVGMVGGHDLGKGPIESYRTQTLKTHSALALQPLLWHPDDRMVKIAARPVKTLCLPSSAAYFLAQVNAPNVQQFATTLGVAPAEADVIASVIARAKAHTITLMTVYGIHQAHDSSTTTLLKSLVAGSLAAAAKGGISRKIVLFVVCKVELADMLDDARASVVTLAAATAQESLDDLEDDHLLVIHAGPLPSAVFQLLVQASNLPVVLEGANTSNLVQMLGKPYVSVSTKTTSYVPVPEDAQKAHEKLAIVTGHLNDGGLAGKGGALDVVATYFHAAATGGDAYDGYFAGLEAHVRRPAQDQLKLGLYRLEKELRPGPVDRVPYDCGGEG